MRIGILTIVLTCCFLGNAVALDEDDSYTLYLVRHAEKHSDGRKDPGLTKTGINRAERLATRFSEIEIKDIWSSDYKRTRETAEPVLSSKGLKLNIYDARDLSSLAKSLLSRQNSALIVGHSNTTPELARLLCQCSVDDMDESEYDRLIVVSVSETGIQVETLQQSTPLKPWPAIAK